MAMDKRISGGLTVTNFTVTSIAFASSSLALIVALAWNEAFKELFDSREELKQYGPWVYAILITVIALMVMNVLLKMKPAGK